MASPSPICTVQDGGGGAAVPTNGATVGAGDTITVALQSTAGVSSWSLTLVGQDDSVTPPVVTVNNTTKTATFTAPSQPCALIYKSTVNNGVDQNGQAQATYSTTFGVYVATAASARLFAANERAEGNASYGWITKLNAITNGTAAVLTSLATNITWLASVTSPTISQTPGGATSTGQVLKIAPQAGGATSGQPGYVVINTAAPNGGSSESFFTLQRNAAGMWQFGPLTSAPSTIAAIYPGNVSPNATNYILYSATDGSNVGFNSSTVIGLNIGGNNVALVQAGVLQLQNPCVLQWAQNSTATINQVAASGAPTGMSMTAQAAGGTNDGATLSLGGGANAGAGTAYGRTIITSPLDTSYLRYSWPSDANQTLTAAQSANNMFRLYAGTITAARTLTVSRKAANPGQILVRNVTGFTITVQWLTGTGVTVSNNTSAWIGSDGTNAEIISVGT